MRSLYSLTDPRSKLHVIYMHVVQVMPDLCSSYRHGFFLHNFML